MMNKIQTQTAYAIIDIVAALGLLGVVAITIVTIPQEAEAKGYLYKALVSDYPCIMTWRNDPVSPKPNSCSVPSSILQLMVDKI